MSEPKVPVEALRVLCSTEHVPHSQHVYAQSMVRDYLSALDAHEKESRDEALALLIVNEVGGWSFGSIKQARGDLSALCDRAFAVIPKIRAHIAREGGAS